MNSDPKSFDGFADEFELLHNLIGDPVGDWLATRLPARGRRALDIGCGTGRHAILLAERFTYVDAVDISPSMVRIAAFRRHRPNIRYLVADAADLPGEPTYDLVLSVSTFHHVDDLPALLRHIRTLVMPGGLVVLHDGICEGLPPSRRQLYVKELRRLFRSVATTPGQTGKAVTIFRLRTGKWLDHRASDRFLSSSNFERIYGMAFEGAQYQHAPNGYVMFWHAP